MKLSHPLPGVSVAIGFVLFVFAGLCTSTGSLAASSVGPSSFCGEAERASQSEAANPATTYDNRMELTIRPTLGSHTYSFTCSPPGTILADSCYPRGSFCNQGRQCCSGVCNNDGTAWGHCQ
jgi:hypothetical protein